MCEQLLGGAGARLCNVGCAAIPTVSPGCHWNREQEGHWNITSMLDNKCPCIIAALCSQEYVGLSLMGNHSPGSSDGVLCTDIIASRNIRKVLPLVSLLEPSTPVGTLLSFPDKAETKWSKWVYCNANLRGLPVYKEIAVVQAEWIPRLQAKA